MSGLTKEELREIIREELHGPHTCRFTGVSDEDAAKVGNFVRSIGMLGDGNLDRG